MKFIFSTGSLYPYGTERCFDLAAQAGFDGIELMVDYRWDTRQPAYLKTLMERSKLPILAVHNPFAVVATWPKLKPGLIQKSVELASAVGSPVVVHHLPMRMGRVQLEVAGKKHVLSLPAMHNEHGYRKWLENDYADIQQKSQKQSGVTLCIENMPARKICGRRFNAHHWNTVDTITRFPTLTMDTTHLGTWGIEAADVYPHWGERIKHVHLSNYDGNEHRLPQCGELDLKRLIAQMAANGYEGSISIELHPDALSAGGPDARVLKRMRTLLDHCRAWEKGEDVIV